MLGLVLEKISMVSVRVRLMVRLTVRFSVRLRLRVSAESYTNLTHPKICSV